MKLCNFNQKIILLNKLDYHNAFLKEVNFFWKTSYEDGYLFNESLPNLSIKIFLPSNEEELILKIGGVRNCSVDFFDDIDVFLEIYATYYRLYINFKDDSPNSFIEFGEILSLDITPTNI